MRPAHGSPPPCIHSGPSWLGLWHLLQVASKGGLTSTLEPPGGGKGIERMVWNVFVLDLGKSSMTSTHILLAKNKSAEHIQVERNMENLVLLCTQEEEENTDFGY